MTGTSKNAANEPWLPSTTSCRRARPEVITLQLESNNPLASDAHELRQFIESKFMGHYLCCLDSHGVKSIRALSPLYEYCVKEISAETVLAVNSSKVEQLCKLKRLVCDAKTAKQAQPLSARLESFFESNETRRGLPP